MRFRRRVAIVILAMAVAASGLAACAQTPPTLAPTNTPIPTPTPTPVPPPSLLDTLDPAEMPGPDTQWSDGLSSLLAAVPQNYSPVIFMDVAALKENPELQRVLKLPVLGLLDTLPADSTSALESLAVALDENNEGVILVLRGPLDIEGLLQLAGGFGVTSTASEPQSYREHRVSSIDLFGVTLAIGSADKSTTVMTSGAPGGATPALDHLKAALDGFDGLIPRLLDDANVSRLVNNLAPGIAAAIFRDCADLGALGKVAGPGGCTGAAVSAEVLDEELVALNLVVAFQTESQAAAAFQALNQGDFRLGELEPKKSAARQEATLLRLRLIVELKDIAVGFDGLGGLQR